ncbi:hypothetical protein CMI47_18970 [Candidatus Pacearchaeota archaeon]|nr:hypothetical protein [Candidatus Pacearchaeota archaeon]|tara:strand:- start:17 stop:307 length:291 start_codon:yes stop_codon:yes gene_type:complete
MNKLKNHSVIGTILKFLILFLLISPIIYFSFLQVRKDSLIEGRIVGHCDFACFMIQSEFGFIDDDGSCWCSIGPGNFMYIPFDLEELFSNQDFDYE